MNEWVTVRLLPLGVTLTVRRGADLQDELFAQGVEFPCGAKGRCKGCRIRVVAGELPPSADDCRLLSRGELDAGWRLACRAQATQDLTIDLAQWETTILADDSQFAFTSREGLGVAVDLGTTTVVAQLLDLETGRVVAVRSGLNAQARFGADVMSRVEFALAGDGMRVLCEAIRRQIGGLIADLIKAAPADPRHVRLVTIVGNTVMHHLFCELSVKPLSSSPFKPAETGLQMFLSEQLEWGIPGNPIVRFLPCIGGFVGSDILAGVMATKLGERPELAALVDLGTNGEIVIGNRNRLLCASTAAGPAFEGARIACGMRAATGAISEVSVRDRQFHCHVIGGAEPRGICGSGLVDAVTAGLDLGWIQPSGRLANGKSFVIAPPVALTQTDVRELQLAKAAIAVGIRLLLDQWGARRDELACVYLAGAFGNYINRASAQRIGLLDFPADKVRPAGNTALLGAKMALFDPPAGPWSYTGTLDRIEHVALNENARFHEVFVDEMRFPD